MCMCVCLPEYVCIFVCKMQHRDALMRAWHLHMVASFVLPQRAAHSRSSCQEHSTVPIRKRPSAGTKAESSVLTPPSCLVSTVTTNRPKAQTHTHTNTKDTHTGSTAEAATIISSLIMNSYISIISNIFIITLSGCFLNTVIM